MRGVLSSIDDPPLICTLQGERLSILLVQNKKKETRNKLIF